MKKSIIVIFVVIFAGVIAGCSTKPYIEDSDAISLQLERYECYTTMGYSSQIRILDGNGGYRLLQPKIIGSRFTDSLTIPNYRDQIFAHIENDELIVITRTENSDGFSGALFLVIDSKGQMRGVAVNAAEDNAGGWISDIEERQKEYLKLYPDFWYAD